MARLPDRETLATELLLLRLKRGERAAAELVQRWEMRLMFYVRKLLRNEQDAWDVLQQTWVRVLPKVAGVREPAALAPWLYTVARHTALAHRNSLAAELARQNGDAMLNDVAAEPAHDDVSPDVDDIRELHAALDRLSAPHREALTLYFLQDLTLEQMAAVLDLPLGTVKSRLHYAKGALRKHFAERNDQ